MINNLKDFLVKYSFFTKKFNKKITYIFFLIFLSSFLELLSITIFLPIIEVISKKKFETFNNDLVESLFIKFNYDGWTQVDFLLVSLFGIVLVFLIKLIFFVFFYFQKKDFLTIFNTSISNQLFHNLIKKNYNYYLKKNTSQIINIINTADSVTYGITLPLILLINDFLTLLLIMIFLLIFNLKLTIIVFLSIGIFLFLYFKSTKKMMNDIGKDRFTSYADKLKTEKEAFDGIKDVIIYGAYNYFIKKFSAANKKHVNSTLMEDLLKSLPKQFIEFFIIILFVLFSFFYFKFDDSFSNYFITVSVFFLASYKLLPISNKIFLNIQTLKVKSYSFQQVYNEIIDGYQSNKNNTSNETSFNDCLEFKNISYKYPISKNNVLNNINLKIKKNQITGIFGESGSGKSTLLNLLCGLMEPSKGQVLVDNKPLTQMNETWLKQIGYVPQNSYLISETVSENIAFGIDKENINLDLVKETISQTKLDQFIKHHGEDTNFLLKQDGKNISGGQIQRIAIARALYRKPKLLILDESTSALDYETENEILKIIKDIKDITVVFVTHRKHTLNICDFVYEIKDNSLVEKKT